MPWLLAYLDRQWLSIRKRLVKAWICHCQHFGNVTTSRLEGFHSVIKRRLPSAHCDWQRVASELVVQAERMNDKTQAEMNTHRVLSRHNFLSRLFNDCRYIVSWHALSLVKKGIDKHNIWPNIVLRRCTGNLRRSMNIPCAHMVQERLQESESLTSADFSFHWRLAGEERPIEYHRFIQNPEPVVPTFNSWTPPRAETGRVYTQAEQNEAQAERRMNNSGRGRRARGRGTRTCANRSRRNDRRVDGVPDDITRVLVFEIDCVTSIDTWMW